MMLIEWNIVVFDYDVIQLNSCLVRSWQHNYIIHWSHRREICKHDLCLEDDEERSLPSSELVSIVWRILISRRHSLWSWDLKLHRSDQNHHHQFYSSKYSHSNQRHAINCLSTYDFPSFTNNISWLKKICFGHVRCHRAYSLKEFDIEKNICTEEEKRSRDKRPSAYFHFNLWQIIFHAYHAHWSLLRNTAREDEARRRRRKKTRPSDILCWWRRRNHVL